MDKGSRTYLYSFVFSNGEKLDFPISIDSKSLYTTTCPTNPPKWARLEHHKCSFCTLRQSESPFCPIALSLVELIADFGQTRSYTPCTVTCKSPDRIVIKETVVQDGLASILGLLMPISGCPVMNFLKPLSRFHLPFATLEETAFRVTGSCFLRTYFSTTAGAGNTYYLSDIRENYTLVKKVNTCIFNRIKDINELDADKNGLVTLTSLAQLLELEFDAGLESIQHYFMK